jgi:hypothetical protein
MPSMRLPWDRHASLWPGPASHQPSSWLTHVADSSHNSFVNIKKDVCLIRNTQTDDLGSLRTSHVMLRGWPHHVLPIRPDYTSFNAYLPWKWIKINLQVPHCRDIRNISVLPEVPFEVQLKNKKTMGKVRYHVCNLHPN